MDGFDYVGMEGFFQCDGKFLHIHVVQKKGTWQIAKYVQLNTMFVVYIHHFASYNKKKTKVTQLIPL
jgi:hypothetical protein